MQKNEKMRLTSAQSKKNDDATGRLMTHRQNEQKRVNK